MQTTFDRSGSIGATPGEDVQDRPSGPRTTNPSAEKSETPNSFSTTNGNGNGNGRANRALIDALVKSKVYQEYERAFSEMTGLPVTLQPAETWQLPHHGKRKENPFCALLAQKSRACAACLQTSEQLCERAAFEPQTITCPVGLCDMAVPVRLSDRLVGFLRTGQVFRKKPTETQFRRASKLLGDWGVQADGETLRKAFFAGRTITAAEHDSLLKLLGIFAQHLMILGNQVFFQQQNAEPPVIKRAKDYINEHQNEELSLGQVAKAVNTSSFYFCKIFKKFTGINFTDYLSRVRIEKAKNLLLNPNLRVSEIAFEVGFQSLTHFNRVFKRILGQSPTGYRAQLLAR
jgi:AraC-like DNA-binding protein/ligand-binding sensor protein